MADDIHDDDVPAPHIEYALIRALADLYVLETELEINIRDI
jgi:hypothetical protein